MVGRILVELYMVAGFLLLYFKSYTGLREHELLGIIMFIVCLTHIWLNRRFFKNSDWQTFNKIKSMNFRKVVTIFLIIFLLGTISTGLWCSELISTVISLSANSVGMAREIHSYFAYGTLVLAILHLVMYFKSLYLRLKQVIRT